MLNLRQPEMQAQFESIFKELGAAGALDGEVEPKPSASSAKPKSAPAPNADQVATDLSESASFQDTIKKTMARMQESGDQATAAAAAEGSEDHFIAEMMKAMKDMPGADGSEEDFSKVLMGMMEQLTNKEILYEPMRELHEKFPAWMEKNGKGLKKEDKDRYEEQQRLVSEMVAKFEEPTYRDENVADREYVVDRMQKVGQHVIMESAELTEQCRCKQQAHRHQTSWVTCHQPRKCLMAQMTIVLPNRPWGLLSATCERSDIIPADGKRFIHAISIPAKDTNPCRQSNPGNDRTPNYDKNS